MTQSLGGGGVKFEKKYHDPFPETFTILKALLKDKTKILEVGPGRMLKFPLATDSCGSETVDFQSMTGDERLEMAERLMDQNSTLNEIMELAGRWKKITIQKKRAEMITSIFPNSTETFLLLINSSSPYGKWSSAPLQNSPTIRLVIDASLHSSVFLK